jgi:hypothetical protein
VKPKRPGGKGRGLPHAMGDNPLDQNLTYLLNRDGEGGPTTVNRRFIDYVPHFVGPVSGATTIDWGLSPVQYVTLTGDAVITFSEMEDGGTYILFIRQNGTGGHAVEWASVRWPDDDPETPDFHEGELILPGEPWAQNIITFIAGRSDWQPEGSLVAFGVGQIRFG